MKLFILAACFLLASESARPQNRKLDSLNQLISKAVTDTERIRLTIDKIDILSGINLDSGIALGRKTLETAQRIHDYRGEIDLRIKLAANYCFKGAYAPAEENLNFLVHFIKPAKDSSDLVQVYSTRGMMYGMQSKYDSSIYWYEKTIGIAERGGITQDLSANYSNLAISYSQLSNFPQALFYQQKALQLNEKNKNEVSEAYARVNIGNTYDNMRDPARAEQSYLKGIELAKKNNLRDVELYGYTNMASMYIHQKKWPETYEFAMKAATLGGAMGDQGIQAASLSKAAIALVNSGKTAEAERLAKKAIAIADSSGQPLNIYQAYSSMGSILTIEGQYAASIPYFEKGFASMSGADLFSIDNAEVYKDLSLSYQKTGNYRKALESYEIASKLTDSARSKENIQKATELNMNYEFEKKQQLQQAEQKARDQVAAAKQLALIVGLAFMLVLAVGAFIGFRNKQKANALLKRQKEEIEQTLAQLKSTQAQLIQSEKMASLGELMAGIAHEIQNPLNFVNNFSGVNAELIQEMNEEIGNGNIPAIKNIASDLASNTEKITKHGQRADAIVKGMLQHSRESRGQKESVDINALAEEYLRLSYQGFRAKDKAFNTSLETHFDPNIGKTDMIPQDISRVLVNLYNNAFYAVAELGRKNPENYKPLVSVSTKKVNGKVEISVKDNGAGIPQKILDKIFQPFFTTKPPGQGTGLGLSLSYDIIKAHGGEFKVDIKDGEGSEFIIQLPA